MLEDIIVSERLLLFALTAAAAILLLVAIRRARGGKEFFIRRLAGMEAIDEAVGRATEMGRPVHFSPGISSLSEDTAAQTLAGLAVLGYVARLAAKYDTELIVTNRMAEILPITEEVVRQSYLSEGKPEKYNPDNVIFLSDEQFAYAAGCMGLMAREKVAANIMMGAFWAESLIFAEGGFAAGSIQVAGTANTHQIPFFIAACDYCLIGEELFAAGAYLSQDPMQVAGIKLQDWGKLAALLLIIVGTVATTCNWPVISDFLARFAG